MRFLLTAFKVYYVLEGPPIGVMNEEEQRKRDQDETLCRGYILSTLTDRLVETRRGNTIVSSLALELEDEEEEGRKRINHLNKIKQDIWVKEEENMRRMMMMKRIDGLNNEKGKRKRQSMVLEMKIEEIFCSKKEVPTRV
ncbi:hypothetical protein Tco_1176635 [Tanacetum coccineum]